MELRARAFFIPERDRRDGRGGGGEVIS